jgi:5'(3')-deoxyribonucleotidase
MIYVDMDGVLANLYDYMTLRMFQKTYKELNDDQKQILKIFFRNKMYFDHAFPEGAEKVFEDLDPFPFNKTLIETVIEFGGEYTILSRPCNLDIEGTKRAKIKWVEKHLAFCPPKDVLLVQDKSANGRAKENILIDDWDDFLIRWKDKGGYPIKYQAADFNKEEDVKNYLSNALKNVM